MGKKTKPKEITISPVRRGEIRVKPEPDSRFLTPNPTSCPSLLQYLEVVAAYSKWLYSSFDHTVMGSVQFSCSVMSDPLQPHDLQHARPPCPSPTPGVHPNPCPLSQWCHPAISSSVIPFSSCPQSFPASGSFEMSCSHQVAKVLEFQLQHHVVLMG